MNHLFKAPLTVILLLILVLGIITCNKKTIPVITTASITGVTSTTASSGGNVTNDGGADVTSRGVCWSVSANPTTANSKTMDGGGTGNFTSNITGLTANTTYHVRAYATNSAGTSFGGDVTFTTSIGMVPPTVTTGTTIATTSTTATSGGNVTSDGGASVTARGVCWGTSVNPTTANSKTTDGTGTGIFTSNITGLTANTTYHVRAYATNSAGTSYGDDVIFITTTSVVPPTVTTETTTATASTTASSGGNVTSDGGATVTARGVCWGTSANPTTANSKTTDGTGTGVFTSNITGLTANTTYHVRAYAINSAGTSYGSDVTFNTPSNLLSPPSLSAPSTSTGTFTVTISYSSWPSLQSSSDCYELEESTVSSISGFVRINQSFTHTSPYSMQLTKASGTYYYRARCSVGSNYTSYSTVVMVVVTVPTRSITLINNSPTSVMLKDIVQVKVARYESGVYVHSDLLTDDPASCLSLPGESIAPGQSRTFNITIGPDYSIFIGMGMWDLDNITCSTYSPFFKRTFFTEASTWNNYWVWVEINVTGHSGSWNWTISGSYLNDALYVTPAGNSPIKFYRTNYSKIN